MFPSQRLRHLDHILFALRAVPSVPSPAAAGLAIAILCSPLLASAAPGAPMGGGRTAASPTAQEITVQLFGQPCLLSGPFPDEVLKAIHAVSPEKNPPPETAAQARQLKARVAAERRLPEDLERYRERLSAHFDARIAFFDGFQAAQKSGQIETLLAAVKSQVPPARQEAFRKRVEALGKKASEWKDDERELLLADFLDFAPALPEEEFHRAIRALNVNYVCTFDEEEGGKPEQR